MQYIKVDKQEQFDDLQNRIHQHRLATIKNYRAKKWANPIVGQDGSILCAFENEDSEVLIEGEVVVDISIDDENYFPKAKLK